MWEKRKSGSRGTELTMEIPLQEGKVLDVSICYHSMQRYDPRPPYAIRMNFIISEVYTSSGATWKRTTFDFANMPKDVLCSAYTWEKRTIGPLKTIADKYSTPEKVLELFYQINPSFKPTEAA